MRKKGILGTRDEGNNTGMKEVKTRWKETEKWGDVRRKET